MSTLANGIMVAECEDYASFQSWNGEDFVVNRGDGRYGAVSFFTDRSKHIALVGVFFDTASPRNPIAAGLEYDVSFMATFLPDEFRRIAEDRAFRFNNQLYNNEYQPIVTALIWGNDERKLAGSARWEELFVDGLSSVQMEIKGRECVDDLIEEYQMPHSKSQLFRAIAIKRVALDVSSELVLTSQEREIILSNLESEDSMNRCRKILSYINIPL